jgi:ribosomal protein L37E
MTNQKPERYTKILDIGHRHGTFVIIGYQHPDNKCRETKPNIEDSPMHGYVQNVRYKIYCTVCGTTKYMYHKNVHLCSSCGCTMGRNFNWEGKSKNI